MKTTQTRWLALVLAATTAWAIPSCNQDARGGGDHDHSDETAPPVVVTIFTDSVQLFMEYPHLVAGQEADFLAHLTVLETGEPIRAGFIHFIVTDSAERTQKLVLDAPRRDGLFVPAWTFESPGVYTLELLLVSGQTDDRINVGELIVHETAAKADAAAHAAERPDPPGLVPFLLEQQWKMNLRYAPVKRRTLLHRLRVPGEIVAPQGASAAVAPPIAGRLLPPPGGRLPRIGDMVQAGQILARIEPAVPVSQAIELQSLEAQLDLRELDLDTNAMQVERNIIQSHAKLKYAQSAMQRAQQLKEKGVGTGQQYDKATQDIRLAEAEVSAAKAMKRSYEKARKRLEQLRAKLTPQASAFSHGNETFALMMRAPIAGEIVFVAHIEGEYLDDTHQEVFRVVNLDHVWVSANISEFDLATLSKNPSATMTIASRPGTRFDLLGEGGRLVYIGKVINPTDRTVSVVYEIPNTDSLFRDGMFADVYLETKVASDAIAIPDKAIVMDNGRPVAFVLHDGERFARRELILGVRDRGFTEVKFGIGEGERVVVKGAYALKLASVAPAEIGHGHAH